MKDYYRILGVAPTNSKEKIQEVYRNISKNFRGGVIAELKPMSDAEMKQIVTSYNILNDDNKRKEYDSQPHFLFRKNAKSMEAGSKKPGDEKKEFKWEMSLMDILLMPFKSKEEPKKEQSAEERAQMKFTLGISMADDQTQHEKVKEEFAESLKLVPEFKEARYNMGLICYKMGSYPEAITHFRKLLFLDSKDQQAKKMIELLE